MRESIEPVPDAPPVLRWWTFGVLILYIASLLVFCGVVTIRNHPLGQGLQTGLAAAAAPPHLPIAPFKVASVERAGPPPRTVCYQVWD